MNVSTNPSILACGLTGDLVEAAGRVADGQLSAAAEIERSMAAADAPSCRHAFVRRFDAMARAAALAVDADRAAGAPVPPLAGLAVSVKDLFDVAGRPSTAASRSLADALPAAADSPAVARLRVAGAALIGHTNLTEFAFSGLGINPHHGTPSNAGTLALDATARIPGGSTSGGAVSVATGAAWAALGSDTRGSIRVPAALHGLVGFKNTQALTPNAGCIPLSFTLDTACAITRSVRDAVLLHEILAARRVTLRHRPLRALRLGLPLGSLLEGLDATVAKAFERCLARLRAAGADIVELALPADDAPAQSSGQISAAEAWAWHRGRIDARQADYDPRVLARIRGGSGISAADYIDRLQARQRWIAQVQATALAVDAFICPTVPIVAPPLQALIDGTDEAFFATNALLLRNPSVVNYLDGCALSLPCQAPDELPVGLMVWAPALHDDTVLDVSLAIEHVLAAAGR